MKKKPMTNFRIGETVYYLDKWVGWDVGVITEFDSDGIGEFAEIKARYGTVQKYIRYLYKTKEDVERVYDAIEEKIKDGYREQITDTKLLLQFMLDNDVSTCEYGDTNAREVAIEKAMELLGIELEF